MTLSLLRGIRVIDLAGEPLAPAGRILADLGADVILIEPPGGSPLRQVPPLVTEEGGESVSPHFLYTSAGKRSVTLDPERPNGYGLLRRLVESSDVVLISDDAEALRRRKLDPATLRGWNDQLIVGSLTPFGLTGPRRRWQGSDLVGWAASGALNTIGEPDRRPVAPGGGLAYGAGSLNVVAGVVLALRARRNLGHGQLIDISLQEAVLSVTMESGPFYPLEGGPQLRVGGRRAPAQGMFPTKDGFVELLPYMPGQWDAMAQWINDDLGIHEATMDTFRGSVAARAPFAELIDGWVEQLSTRFTKQDFLIEAQRRGIPCGAVNEPADLLTDPHLAAVDGWQEREAPGIGPVRMPRPPLRWNGVAMGTGEIPVLGAANDELYGGEMGLDDNELAALRADGSI